MEYFFQMMEELRYMEMLTCAVSTTITRRRGKLLRNGKQSRDREQQQPEGTAVDNPSPSHEPALDPVDHGKETQLNGHTRLNGANEIAVNGTKTTRSTVAGELLEEAGVHDKGDEIVCVRPYRTSDREAFYRLCCDTGFLGRPVDMLFHDRELFANLFTRPYLDYEPERILVAEVHGQVAGYLLGSVRKHFDVLLMWSGLRTISKMLLRLATGQYVGYPRSRQFIRWLLTAGFREQPKHPHHSAHLHIQVDKRYRGRGIGHRLWAHYEKELRAMGMTQCYGAFFSYPERRPEIAYRRYGFTVFDRRPTTMFQPEISEPVEVVCVCKKL